MSGGDLDACLVKAINFSPDNKITQREKSRRDRGNETEMNPHYFTEERTTGAANMVSCSEGCLIPECFAWGGQKREGATVAAGQ